MTEQEMEEFLMYMATHQDDIVRAARRAKRSRKKLVIRFGTWVAFVTLCGGAGYLLHIELAYKGFEFIGAALTDQLLLRIWE